MEPVVPDEHTSGLVNRFFNNAPIPDRNKEHIATVATEEQVEEQVPKEEDPSIQES